MTDHSEVLEHPSDIESIASETGFTIGFGNRCNEYVDVIQQALDLALGNSGNLAPDSAVVDALDELYIAARNAGAAELLQLLVPLNQVLRSAEQAGFTLSQADTLLVQEAIIAITLGIDSIVNQKATPALLADVTQRMVDVAAENKHEIRANSEATGLINIFVSDADELLQRLFEQIQRWRASAFVGRGHEEVNRLLMSLHNSADSAGLSSIAHVVHLLILRMSAQRVAGQVPDENFFDLAIETVEILGDDLDRIRNNEQLIDHTELYEKLGVGDSGWTTNDLGSVGNGVNSQAEAETDAQDDIADIRDEQNSAPEGLDGLPEKVADVHVIDSADDSNSPDRRELVDVLREISRRNEAIKERIEQLRRTIHVYPEARQLTLDTDADKPSSSVSAIDNLFFKIDSLLSRQRKSVTNMASVLGMEEQQTVEALVAELIKHTSLSALSLEYRGGSGKVVVDSQLYDHLGYALRIVIDSIVLPSTAGTVDPLNSRRNAGAGNGIVFDLIDDRLCIQLVGAQLQLSEFAVANASLRRVDEQMLKSQLPRLSNEEQGARTKDHDLVTLAALQRLIDIAAFFQGRVTTSLNWNGGNSDASGEIEIRLPVRALNEELVLVKTGQRIYGVQSAVIEKIESVTSVEEPGVLVRCRRSRGGIGCIRADAVVGKLRVSVTRNPWLMLGSAYSGAFVFSDSSLVLVLNPESLDSEAPMQLID